MIDADTEKMAALKRLETLTAERDAARADADRLAAALMSVVYTMVLHQAEVAQR